MKKLVPAIVALLAVICAGLVFLWREEPYQPRAAEIAPPEAILFAHLPDLRRSAEHWPETAIAKLWNEPEMRAFFAQPLEEMPALIRAQEHWERLLRIAPREAFLAVTQFDGSTPKFVAGLNFTGSKSEVAALVAKPWADWRKSAPSGKAELLRRAEWEIETFTSDGGLLAGSFHDGWYFLATDLAALEQTLARCKAGGGVGHTAAWQQATVPMPVESDAFVFAQPGRLLEFLGALLARGDRTPAGAERVNAPGALAWSVRLEGARIRDTVFLTGNSAPAPPLARSTHALTAAESLGYAAMVLPSRLEMPPATSALTAFLAASPIFALASEPMSWAEFSAAFGPECGLVLDWPTAADAPSVTFVFEVRNPDLASGVVARLTSSSEHGLPWQREERAGVIHYEAPTNRKAGTTPALALTPQFAVLGAQAFAVRTVAARLAARDAQINDGAAFQEISARVGTPTMAFAYLQLPDLVARSYEALRPFLGMSLSLSPETGPYFDTSKLPSATALTRHLGPTVYSQSTRSDGTLIESVGSLSFSQTLAGLAAVAWSSVAPTVQRLNQSAEQTVPTAKPEPSTAQTLINAETPAETSKTSQNADEKSHIRASQP